MAKISSGDKKAKKSKKSDSESDSDTIKQKREPSVWVKFTSRIHAILKENDSSFKDVGTEKQFCSYLKTIKAYDEWDDDDVLAEKSKWVKPEISKQEAAGKNKNSRKSSRRSSVAEESEKEEPKAEVKKEQKPEPEKKSEVKKEQKEQKPEKKAEVKKEEKPEPEKKKPGRPKKVVEKTEEKKPEPEKKKAGRPKKVVEKVEEAEEESDEIDFDGFEHEGTLYLKSKEGYLLDTDGEWIGIFDGETIDEDAEEPEKVKQYRATNFKD